MLIENSTMYVSITGESDCTLAILAVHILSRSRTGSEILVIDVYCTRPREPTKMCAVQYFQCDRCLGCWDTQAHTPVPRTKQSPKVGTSTVLSYCRAPVRGRGVLEGCAIAQSASHIIPECPPP